VDFLSRLDRPASGTFATDYIKGREGAKKIVDFANSEFALMSYSVRCEAAISLGALKNPPPHVPDQP